MDALEIPVIIAGREAGRLRVSQEGLYTVLEAALPDAADTALVRLWVHGDGGSAYLGVMQPWSGGLWLRRRLSALERRRFPAIMDYASDTEETAVNDKHNIVDIKEETVEKSLHNNNDQPAAVEEEQDKESLHNQKTTLRACPWPAEPGEEGLLWYSRGDGSLVAFDGVSTLLALPARLRKANGRAVERVIEGKRYLVFRV